MLAGWLALAVCAAAVLSTDTQTTLLVLAIAATGIVAAQGYRQHHLVLHELRQIRALVAATERAAVESGTKAGEALDRVKLSGLSLERISEDLRQSAEGVHHAVARSAARVSRELEALENLYAMIPVGRPMPSVRHSGTSADAVLALVELLRSNRPSLLAICGNVVPALWAALAAQRFGIDTRIIVLEHDEQLARSSRGLLAAHGVANRVEVREAQLEILELGGEVCEWYGRQAFVDLQQIDLLFVCPTSTRSGPDLRSAALPALIDRIADGGVILLDESDKDDYLEIADQWLASIPGLSRDHLECSDGISLLRVRRSTAGISVTQSPLLPEGLGDLDNNVRSPVT